MPATDENVSKKVTPASASSARAIMEHVSRPAFDAA
jgi:hypothetical protein